MFDYRFSVLYTSLFYTVLSWVGARVFSTYLGVVRYSSFVDLLQVAYANVLSLFISIVVSYLLEYYDIEVLTAFSQSEIVIAYFIATLLMWGVRIVVKTLHDVSINVPAI